MIFENFKLFQEYIRSERYKLNESEMNFSVNKFMTGPGQSNIEKLHNWIENEFGHEIPAAVEAKMKEILEKWLGVQPKYMTIEMGEDDFVLTVNGDIKLLEDAVNSAGELKIPFYKVNGSIDCSDVGLTSLIGFPSIVRGDFDCSGNKLKSLEFCPARIEGDFDCSKNPLVDVNGVPRLVRGEFRIDTKVYNKFQQEITTKAHSIEKI